MYQPYYFNSYMNSYPQSYPQFPQQPVQNSQNIQMQDTTNLNAKYVSGWEEVKNIPYTEKPIMLLDSNAKKLYIKGINEKGDKEIETYSLIEDVKELPKENVKMPSPIDIDVKIENEINKVKEELQDKIISLENQIKSLKDKKGGN